MRFIRSRTLCIRKFFICFQGIIFRNTSLVFRCLNCLTSEGSRIRNRVRANTNSQSMQITAIQALGRHPCGHELLPRCY
jgi:hypothetical protein